MLFIICAFSQLSRGLTSNRINVDQAILIPLIFAMSFVSSLNFLQLYFG